MTSSLDAQDIEHEPAKESIPYREAVGFGTRPSLLADVKSRIDATSLKAIYEQHQEVPFLYEVLDTRAWHDSVRGLVDCWAAVCVSTWSNVRMLIRRLQG